MNQHEPGTAEWWREEARISADDGHPDAAVAAMAQALEHEGREDATEMLARYKQAMSERDEKLFFGLGLGEPWKLTIRNEAGQVIEFTADELYELARWLRSHLHGEARAVECGQ